MATTVARMSRQARGYGAAYERERARLLASSPPCAYCGRPADTADHVPPLSEFPDRRKWFGVLVPACWDCNSKRGRRLAMHRRRRVAASRAW